MKEKRRLILGMKAKAMSVSSILAVKTCSNAISALCLGHGKSPCFSQVAFLGVVSPDYRLLILPSVDGAENMECAFCYGNK